MSEKYHQYAQVLIQSTDSKTELVLTQKNTSQASACAFVINV